MEEQKKYFIISTILFVIIAIVILQVDKYHDNKVNNNYTLETNKISNQYINLDDFGIYLQNESNRSQYDKQNGNTYPTQGYILNTNKTECYDYNGTKQTGKVSQTDEGNVKLETTTSIYCKMYFDIDKDAPTAKTFNISGKDKDNQTRSDYIYDFKISYTVTWDADDVVEYCITDGSSCSNYIKTNKAKSVTGDITLNNSNQSDGVKTLKVYLKDRAKNVSTKDATITLDRTAPTISGLTLTGNNTTGTSLSNSNLYTHTPSVNANITWSDNDVVSYCITTNTTCGANEWTTISSKSATKAITTSTTEGDKTIYAFIKDRVGNVSGVKSGSIYLDTGNPTASIDSASSTEDSITVTIGGTDSGSGINKRECRVTTPGESNWITADSSNNCTISTLSNGSKLAAGTTYTVEARTTDRSGRVSTTINGSYATKSLKPAGYVKSQNPAGLSTELLGGLYRFVGACDAKRGGCTGVVDNFVCFGTADPNLCKGYWAYLSDFVFRIIGIDPITGDLKLIKNKIIIPLSSDSGQFYWDNTSNSSVEWSSSTTFRRLNGLGTGSDTSFSGDANLFLGWKKAAGLDLSTGSKWYNMIKTINWRFGDISEWNDSADDIYAMETGLTPAFYGDHHTPNTWTKSVDAKIGLLYLHDFYYSYAVSGTNSASTNCNDGSCKSSWLNISNNVTSDSNLGDWMMSRCGAGCANVIPNWGTPTYRGVSETTSVFNYRPVFYLDASKTDVSTGKGTVDDPFVATYIEREG